MLKNVKREPNIWVLKTDHAGDTNNRLAIARAISPHNCHLIDFHETHGDVEKMLLTRNGVELLTEVSEWPDIFITCEQQTSLFAKDLKKLSKGRVFVVGLQTPDIDNNDFDGPYYRDSTDMQVLFKHHKSSAPPAHHKFIPDAPKNREAYDYVPTYITQDALEQAALKTPIAAKKPVYMLVMGSVIDSSKAFGHSNWESFPHEVELMERNIRQMVRGVAELAKKNGGSVLVTTSRRTGEQFTPIIQEELSGVESHIYDWSKSKGNENPYLSMLAAADRIIVSGDSISMTADALASGKPTFIYVPSKHPEQDTRKTLRKALDETSMIRDEVKIYMQKLAGEKMIHPMSSLDKKHINEVPALNSAPDIAKDVLIAYEEFKSRSLEI